MHKKIILLVISKQEREVGGNNVYDAILYDYHLVYSTTNSTAERWHDEFFKENEQFEEVAFLTSKNLTSIVMPLSTADNGLNNTMMVSGIIHKLEISVSYIDAVKGFFKFYEDKS